MTDLRDVRCGGSGLLYEVLTPHRDPRDPAYEDREYECPGCPDCASVYVVVSARGRLVGVFASSSVAESCMGPGDVLSVEAVQA